MLGGMAAGESEDGQLNKVVDLYALVIRVGIFSASSIYLDHPYCSPETKSDTDCWAIECDLEYHCKMAAQGSGKNLAVVCHKWMNREPLFFKSSFPPAPIVL